MPKQPRAGAQRKFLRSHEVFGNSSSAKRRPASSTATRYPFSASRRAATLPPNPEPTTTTSKSLIRGTSRSPVQYQTDLLELLEVAVPALGHRPLQPAQPVQPTV